MGVCLSLPQNKLVCVKTGDETPVELWIGLLGIAALAIVGAGAIKRKGQND